MFIVPTHYETYSRIYYRRRESVGVSSATVFFLVTVTRIADEMDLICEDLHVSDGM